MATTAPFERELALPLTMRAVTSTTVRAVAYDDYLQVLTVLFASGSSYRYFDVPEWLYRALLDAQPHPWSAVGRLVRSYPVKRLSQHESQGT